MSSIFKPVAAGAVLIALASPAAASPLTYTITGTIIGGGDSTGIFKSGSDLTGMSFTAVEIFDPSKAPWTYGGNGQSGATGGSSTNGLSFADVTLTIGNGSKSFSDYTSTVSDVGGSQFNSFIQSSGGINKDDIGFYIQSPDILPDYTLDNSISGLSKAYTGYYTLTNATGAQIVWANLEVTGLTAFSDLPPLDLPGQTGVSAVPLPGTFPLFAASLLILAAISYSVKRTRRNTAAR